MLPTRGSSGGGSFLRGFSVGGLSVCWLRSEIGKSCEISDCLADAGVASGRGLSGRVVVVSVACDLCSSQKPVELLVPFLHLDLS